MRTLFQGLLLIAGLGLSLSAGAARSETDLAAGTSFGAAGLTVLPNRVAYDRPLRQANAETRSALMAPDLVAAAGWGEAVAGRILGAQGLSDGFSPTTCGFADWADLADWLVEEGPRAVRPIRTLAEQCGGTACLSGADGDDPADVAGRLLTLPGADMAGRTTATALLALARRVGGCAATLPSPPAGERVTAAGRILFYGPETPQIAVPDDAILVVGGEGNTVWTGQAPRPGRWRILVDPEGDDLWQIEGQAVLSGEVILDLSGDDRYGVSGPGQAATLGGVSILIDWQGQDVYHAGARGQASAAAGAAFLLDGGGNDRYEAQERSQAYAGPGGLAVLWDRAGDDRYQAGGTVDPRHRGGVFSYAQGMATGHREGLGGGTALLLDDSGDDAYSAGLFAQGAGYYDGLGLLLDRRGDDTYQAVRYAQGAGVHRAVGVLEDLAGADRYRLEVGVGQGMGLDSALGVLSDRGGDDSYQASALAQGASTANGIGVLRDGGGTDRFMLADFGWGQDHWFRGLPGLAFLLGTDAADTFVPPGGPRNRADPVPDPTGVLGCPVFPDSTGAPGDLLRLRQAWPGAGEDAPALAAAADIMAEMPEGLGRFLAAIDDEDFAAAVSARDIVRCWMDTASPEQRQQAGQQVVSLLQDHPGHLGWVAGPVLLGSSLPPERVRPSVEGLVAAPLCRTRAAGLRVLKAMVPDHPALKTAVTDACFEARAVVRPWPFL